MAGLLAGVRVVEMANVITGPYAGMVLADLGAEVIKVELPKTGDPFRRWGSDAVSSPFTSLNRGKKSVTIDVKQPEGLSLYVKLCGSADVVIENFRPGVLDDYGVGYYAIREVNPRVVYCSISGMGSDGPWKDRPVFDSVVEGMAGLWSQLMERNDPKPVGPPFADQVAGLYAAIAVLSGLVRRAATGKGGRLETTMFGSSLAFQFVATTDYLVNGRDADSLLRAHRSQSFAFVASDGKPLTIHLSSPVKFWDALLTALDRHDLASDDRFREHKDRIERYDELRAELAYVFAQRTRDEWVRILESHDVPTAPINTIGEALEEPQVNALGLLEQFGEGERALHLIGSPITNGDEDTKARLPVPELGEHNAEIFGALGYDEATLGTLGERSTI